MAARVSEVGKRFSLDNLVPYGPGLGSASIITEDLFELTGSMGSTNMTTAHLLIYLFEKGTKGEKQIIEDLFGFKTSDDIKKYFALMPSRTWGVQKISPDQITISREVQLIFRRAKQISAMLKDRFIDRKHLLMAIFKECELNHHTCAPISSLMVRNGVTSHKVLERVKAL